MHFDFAFMEFDIVPSREGVRSYVIRTSIAKPDRHGQSILLCEVSQEALVHRLAEVLGGERSRDVDVFPTDPGVDDIVRLEQESFTDGQRGPDGYPRNLTGVALNHYRRDRNDATWLKIAGSVMSMQEAFHLLDALRHDQCAQAPGAVSTRAERLVMTSARSALAPIPGSDPDGPIPPFPLA